VGTEIRTFGSLKELSEFLANQTIQYKALFEDYSQWLGSLLRDFESAHKNDAWFQKMAVLQKNLKVQSKKPAETEKGGKGGKGKENSCWVQTGNVLISITEQGQTEILFEAIEKLSNKIQETEKFKETVQQLTRLGLGATVNYIVYIEDDIPKRIVIKQRANGEEPFKFITELTVPSFLLQ